MFFQSRFRSISIYTLVITFLYCLPISTYNITYQLRDISSLDTNKLSGFHEQCRFSSECVDDLVCRKGYCVGSNSLGEIGESCQNYSECLSSNCKDQTCLPGPQSKGDNNYHPCKNTTDCRSNICRSTYCFASSIYKGLPGHFCNNESDCLSGLCAKKSGKPYKICDFGGSNINCALIGEKIPRERAYLCCSGLSNGKCLPRQSNECTNDGNCIFAAGKICALPGEVAMNSSVCCSGKKISGRCVQDYGKLFQPCLKDNHCRIGQFCSKRNLCQVR